MRATTLLPLLASITSASAAGNSVKYSTKAELENYLTRYDRLLVSFTSQSLEVIRPFNSIFVESSSTKSSTPLVNIDCDDNLELCHDHDINTYPAIRLYERDKEDELREVRYRGPRTINAIRSFVRKRELPILTKLSSSDMEDFKMMDDLVVIAYLDPNDQASLDTIKYAAERHHLDFVFGYTTSTSQGVSTPSLICYRNTDADHRTLTDLLSLSTIESFLVTSLQPAITSFSEKNIATYMQRDKLTLYIFIPHSYPTSILLRTLTPLAKQFVKFVAFTLVDVQRYTDMAGNFGVGVGSAGPVIVVHAPGNDNVFLYEEGRRIERGVVEGMLMGILKGEARSGQVFGGEARWEGVGEEHDEL